MITPFRIGWLGLSLALFTLLGYGVLRPQFPLLITLYLLVFWGYTRVTDSLWRGTVSKPGELSKQPEPDRFLFATALLFRLSLVVVIPNLSDDYARFIWDGRLLAHGYNPYLYLPAQVINTPIASIAGLTDSLYQRLNSPRYFTVYPPLNQALFGLAGWLSPTSLIGAVISLRVPILLADMGSIVLLSKLLRRFGKNPNYSLLYALNPLVILELTGNLHFEAIMIFFVLLSVWLLVQNHWIGSSAALASGIGMKLLPLIFLPLLIRYLGWKRGLIYAGLTGILVGLLFVPFISIELLNNIFSSLNLYFQSFEFNASVYYLIRAAGYWLLGFNIIAGAGFMLFVVIGVCVLIIAFRNMSYLPGPVIAMKVLLTLTLYWLLSTTVHPWYITSLVAASVFTPFRYPLVWSGVVVLSYSAYQTTAYTENLWLTGLEYSLVLGVGLYEWYRLKNQSLPV
jgi:alpha-1,6-mannosyltransferase